MADEKKTTDLEAMHLLAMERFRKSETAEADEREEFIDDLRFAIRGEQWPDKVKKDRGDRPCLTENRLPTFLAQIIGDQRQNRPRIKVRPVDSKSDVAVASIFTGTIKNIENTGQAESLRDGAFEFAITAGWGYYGIHTRYADEMSFNQEIYYRHIPNPLSVYDDPNAKLPDRSDRKYCFIIDTVSKEEFKSRYPKAESDAFPQGSGDYSWIEEDTVRIAEYWYVKPETKTIVLLSNGVTIEKKDFIEGVTDESNGEPITIVKERTTEVNEVYSCIISGHEVIEKPKKWAGKYIPLIYVGGKEMNVEGKRYRNGLVRWAKDPQRMHNYWLTTTTETVALQPKIPYVGTAKQFEGFENEWAVANTSNKPFLRYKVDPAAPGAPQRQPVAMLPQGSFTMMQQSIDGIKATMGIYDASLGNRSNETSGKAIMARQKEGDVGTFVYMDNLSKAIAFEGRVLVDLIPKIYDTAQIIRIVNPDESEKFVAINQPLKGEAVKKYGVDKKAEEGTIYALDAGKYDVVVETGPSYTTQRTEASDSMTAVVQAAPKLLDIAGDIYFKNQDWPGAQEIGERWKKTLPPGLVEPEEGEKPPPPPQPTPAEQIEMQKVGLEAEKLKVESEKLDVEKFKLMFEGENLQKTMRQIALDAFQEVVGGDMNG